MGRTLALGLAAAAALAAGGCSQDGSFRLSWSFAVGGVIESSASACGQHGVDSIIAVGTDDAGDGEQVTALCTPGWTQAMAPVGTWTFSVYMVDANGQPVRPISPPQTWPAIAPVTTPAAAIRADGPPLELAVQLTPPPECNDGIDNDGDSLVDRADPDCADLNGTQE